MEGGGGKRRKNLCFFLYFITTLFLRSEASNVWLSNKDKTLIEQNFEEKPGRCPKHLMDKNLCPEDIQDQCHSDADCSGNGKCCTTGCSKVCVTPLNSGCELVRENNLRRGRAIGLENNQIDLPQCKEDGTFVEIQCQGDKCYCVDSLSGFERPGTRARSLELVNCSDPLPCAGYQCRMLCPFDFDLDGSGCPICQCRDPCVGVKCPQGTNCIMEEVTCDNQPCPPLPTCKEPRSLSSLCPMGDDPLLIDESAERPFLCGNESGKPTCPPLYTCQVNRGHEYGVCCAAVDQLIKPGTCPMEGHSINIEGSWDEKEEVEVRCGATCNHDLQCPSTQKCCLSEVCGQHCVHPANLTACLQQKMIAELLIASEKEGHGYIPQCDEATGLYAPKQCSRNGLVCWCTDLHGMKYPRTMAAAHEVHCENFTEENDSRCASDESNCSTICEYGYSLDDFGCPTCNCEDPCSQLVCSEGTSCIMRDEPSCTSHNGCPGVPMCITEDSSLVELESNSLTSRSVIKNVTASSVVLPNSLCPMEKEPLMVEGHPMSCTPNSMCPFGYVCITSQKSDQPGTCCPFQIDITRPGQCPFVRGSSLLDIDCSEHTRCYSDGQCEAQKKCCFVSNCNDPICVEPLASEFINNSHSNSESLQGPTMCEYLRDLVQLEGVSLALATPVCDGNGAYEPIQCNALGQCWCVDDFGTPIPNTKVSTRELAKCDRLRLSSSCGDFVCRLGCDYGFLLDSDSACPICECRDPCQNVDCGLLHECQMVDVPCIDGVCPPIPQCVPSVRPKSEEPSCVKGIPYIDTETNITLTCSPRARALECPAGYACEAGENSIEGVCCPATQVSEKPGQCPYLIASASGSCDLECSEDSHCQEEYKCCSNGCGTFCVQPITLTACQHQRVLLEHRAKEAEIPADRVFLPQCDESGDFLPTQCHPGTLTCWCVDPKGLEIAGTRVSSPAQPNCQEPLLCPAMNCNLACLHGYQLDNTGCPICACRDPCEEVTCSSPSEECRIVHVACVSDPCPPLPVCLPKLENPCPAGTPLAVNGSLVECGPHGQICPSTHKCHLSPLGEYALCCPKPRDACFKERDSGMCEGSIQKWFFNPDSNRCERFRYGGCGGNLNNFESKEQCAKACPVLTSCQKIRHKNLKYSQYQKKVTFLPKCNEVSGDWLPVQCLEELGVCWCVTPEGNQVANSLTRGSPSCGGSSRSARLLNFNVDPSEPTNLICEAGQAVHVCDKEMCNNKICLSNPGAICRVNPCGGCTIQFADKFNSVVDCEFGLTKCQRKLQATLNSDAFSKPHSIDSRFFTSAPAPPPIMQNIDYDIDLLRNADVYHRSNFEGKLPWEVSPTAEMKEQNQDMELIKRRVVRSPYQNDIPKPNLETVKDTDASTYAQIGVYPTEQIYPEVEFYDSIPIAESVQKPGRCPAPFGEFSLLQCNPTQDCTVDTDCPSNSKCCFTGCGTMCLQPTETGSGVLTGMMLEPAQCHSDGSWVREQRSGDLTWCVDTKGRPFHETLTRGHVRCGPSGQMLERISVGLVCPLGIKPMVCTEECESAKCLEHPDAICVADPCNNCRVSFYKNTGEVVNCKEKCMQPVSRGMCRANFRRYFYNSAAKECQEFIYGGCKGNDNNFNSLEECQLECQNTVSVCEQPVDFGHCVNGEARWFYNKQSRKCEPFLYSGCGGNENNFKSKETCEATCPDMVLCPYWSANSMEPKPCKRSTACANQTCQGYPDTFCKVDPCDCTAHFVNNDGQEVSCMMPTQPPKTRVAFTFEEESSGRGGVEEDKLEPVTIFLEGEPSLSRCQLLQRHLRENKSQRYITECDAEGRFIPTQCYTTNPDSYLTEDISINEIDNDIPTCWCVDEIGQKTQPTVYFKKGERHCDAVSVESVVVTLGFRGRELGIDKLGQKKGKEIKKQVGLLLQQLSAETLENEINIIDLPDITQVKFTLLGKNKVDVAYQLEDQVRRGGLALKLDKGSLAADLRASWFHHQVSEPRWNIPLYQSANEKMEPREVVSQVVQIDPPYLAAMVVLTIISALLVCGLIMGIMLYRRHITGQYPKAPRGSLQSLAFSDSSFDRRSNIMDSRLSTPNTYPKNKQFIPPISTITTIEDEYRASMH